MEVLRKSRTGKLNTVVYFWEYQPNSGPEPGEKEKKVLYSTRAEIYAPSRKDLEILNGTGTKEGTTIIIRDPRGKYIPINNHFVEIKDYRLSGNWNILDVRNDIAENRFITILLGITRDG